MTKAGSLVCERDSHEKWKVEQVVQVAGNRGGMRDAKKEKVKVTQLRR